MEPQPHPSANSLNEQEQPTKRQLRLYNSLHRLTTHPAVNPTGPHGPHGVLHSSPNPSPSSNIVQALFDDLVRRQLGVDPHHTRSQLSSLIDRHLMSARSVAPKPSLEDPNFIARLATNHNPALLTDKETVSKTLPLDNPPLIRGAAQIHLAIERARSQRIRRSTEKAKAANDLKVRNNLRTPSLPQNDAIQQSHSPQKSLPNSNPRPSRASTKKPRSSLNSNCRSECCLCPDPALYDNNEIVSELIGPFVDKKGVAQLFVHFDCACWAPQVFTDSRTGQLHRVYEEYLRGRQLKCSQCSTRGATIGCYVQKCKQVFHYRCLAPAGAKRVDNFFVAYCSNHAHLGNKTSYKILMEAATIADIAAVHRREDTTYGLDAPHSRYTLLRRRETEVVFSRKWGICSHNGAFETATVVFSHRRRAVLKKSDKLSFKERPRALLVSAIDVASGRLAYMAIAGAGKKTSAMSAVEARAALASRENTSLLLLRNLRRAPRWTKDQITVVRNSAPKSDPIASTHAAVVKNDAQPSDLPSSSETKAQGRSSVRNQVSKPASSNAKKSIRIGERDSDGASTGRRSAADSPPKRRRSRRRSISDMSTDNDSQDVMDKQSNENLKSARLPALKKPRTESPPVKEISEPQPDALPKVSGTGDVQESPSQDQQVSIEKHLKVAESVSGPEKTSEAVAIGTGRQGLSGKVKSAWETFLEEHLPKERLLRPDDPMSDAYNNMARLWSLLTVNERNTYEERARLSGTVPDGPLDLGHSTENNEKSLPYDAPLNIVGLQSFGGERARNAGLFGTTALHSPDVTKNVSRTRVASVSLPRRKRPETNKPDSHATLASTDWDDLLPTVLGDDLEQSQKPNGNQKLPSPRVLPPPARRNSPK